MSLNASAPIIFGCTGQSLDADEKAFFKEALPAGFILFKKNCESPAQTKALVEALRDCVGWHAPVLIDQEGGRVQRLRPPHWPNFPAPKTFGDAYGKNAGRGLAALHAVISALASVQGDMDIDINCIPLLDVVPADNTVMAINDRAFGHDPNLVGTLGLAVCKTAIENGMTPVIKHIPGHGRAVVDSHFELPRVSADAATLAQSDFLPFKTVCAGVDAASVWGMTAHVIYEALDTALPATLSPTIIQNVIRNQIGFQGLLLTDDLFMEALGPWGDVPTRAALAIKAGCDIALHCHGTVPERAKAMKSLPEMRTDTRARLAAWHAARPQTPALKPVDTLISAMEAALAGC